MKRFSAKCALALYLWASIGLPLLHNLHHIVRGVDHIHTAGGTQYFHLDEVTQAGHLHTHGSGPHRHDGGELHFWQTVSLGVVAFEAVQHQRPFAPDLNHGADALEHAQYAFFFVALFCLCLAVLLGRLPAAFAPVAPVLSSQVSLPFVRGPPRIA